MNNYFLLLCISFSSLSFAGTDDKPSVSQAIKDACRALIGHQQLIIEASAYAYDTDSCYGALSLPMPEYEHSSPRTNNNGNSQIASAEPESVVQFQPQLEEAQKNFADPEFLALCAKIDEMIKLIKPKQDNK